MNSESVTVPITSVRFVKELYPRLRENDEAIERYRTALDLLPPIVIARDGILVDGFHRLQAHKRENVEEIKAVNLGNLSDAEIFRESITRNAKHGQQLSAKDKQNLAGKLWMTFSDYPIEERVKEIASLLAVNERTVRNYTKDARAEEKRAMQEKAWDMWLNCETQQSIADELGVDQKTISNWLGEMENIPCFLKAPESQQHFDVWSFQNSATNAGTPSYFGKLPPQIIENLLWLYTEPGQIIFDPFVGGGTTIDVAKTMGRRVWASDRKPSTPTLPIHEHDITTGWHDEAPKCPDFIFLDPPYWMQAAGRYSNDIEDLGNMSLDAFTSSWNNIIKTCFQHQKSGSHLAFIVSPAEDKDNDRVVDLGFIMYQGCIEAGYRPRRRIIATYNTQQATGQQVTWARENKKLLKLYRDVVVFRR